MTYVNLGCGSRFHPDWTNFDIVSYDPAVIAADLSKGIPLEDNSADVVYHSHVLEHIRRNDAPTFIRECLRVLKPGGVIRIAVPDLERIARGYLATMEASLQGDQSARENYEWMMLELFDQTVRERSGGGMVEYLSRKPLPNEAFIYDRIGEEGRAIVAMLQASNATPASTPKSTAAPARSNGSGMKHRIAKRLIRLLMRVDGNPESYLYWLTPERRREIEIGQFRLAGEVHQWMYDRYSLRQLLHDAGFADARQVGATESAIPDWVRFELDCRADGTIFKPDSLFMEAVKPASGGNGR
jgi:predicted SAM-dependent methyltransferase